MNASKFYIIACSLFLLMSCKTVQQSVSVDRPEVWFNVIASEDLEVYTDTTSIRHEGDVVYAREKRIYLTDAGKKQYIDKIRAEYTKMGKPEKIEKWNDFSYCIYHCLYECSNRRFRILSVEDFDSTGKRIIKTVPPKNKITWLNVDTDTVGDYTFFFVCDFE